MKTHSERVSSLREYKEQREARFRRDHVIAITSIFVTLILFVVLGAAIPGFYKTIYRTHPLVQVAIVVIPVSLFAFWRLMKMLGNN